MSWRDLDRCTLYAGHRSESRPFSTTIQITAFEVWYVLRCRAAARTSTPGRTSAPPPPATSYFASPYGCRTTWISRNYDEIQRGTREYWTSPSLVPGVRSFWQSRLSLISPAPMERDSRGCGRRECGAAMKIITHQHHPRQTTLQDCSASERSRILPPCK
ncbi:hypothetical protein BDY17DRAFT_60820 [Neohortaea acidophila]|uniref:Uncharacterized protein n=1 Tax=Neohortaea acidophila TaxID=245834 RepID=A0A6A6PGZ4_9PEZI|nr:uncharacterized protein BDY17DRAFT_60820 [Neohortaea acidophila]KAF2478883.1 hypothetical protein BDY17DRAFT_60820 [Neohortaea acidophila]